MTKRIFPIKTGSFTNLTVKKDAEIWDVIEVKNDATVLDNVLIKGNLIVEDKIESSGGISGTVSEAQDFHIWKDLTVQSDATIKDDLSVGGIIKDLRLGAHVSQGAPPSAAVGFRQSFTLDSNWGTNCYGLYTSLNGDYSHSWGSLHGHHVQADYKPTSIKSDIKQVFGGIFISALGSGERFTFVELAKGLVAGLNFSGGDSTVHTAVYFDTYSWFSASDFKIIGEHLGLRINDLPNILSPATWAIWTGRDRIRFGGDTTVKAKLYIEGNMRLYDERTKDVKTGLTTDFTCQGIVFEVVNGLIVSEHHHS